MAHRKLQQEIDRVFKKINEGLEIFDTFYERHENCTNNPSQKDKLEADLKREVKKLQRLREQIKSWQTSAEVKDKDSLLDYRRSVEVAMEKYKAVEKASKEKAYSNNSLKRSEVLDPEEQERREVSDYLSEMIEELERQYEHLQVEMDRITIQGKKKRLGFSAGEKKKQELKTLQGRYRWHQQQMELALRLLANKELDSQAVRDIQDDIGYFIDSNQDSDFVEDETIYESLNLDANEAIAHEVAASFAAQMMEESMDDDTSKDLSKLSKKEQRKLEREAKKAAKVAAHNSVVESATSTCSMPFSSFAVDSEVVDSNLQNTSPCSSTPKQSPTPSPSSTNTSSIPSTANTTNIYFQSLNSQTPLTLKPQNHITHEFSDHQENNHIYQPLNGVTTSTSNSAVNPIKPSSELKWSMTTAQALEKEKTEKTSNVNFIDSFENDSSKTADAFKLRVSTQCGFNVSNNASLHQHQNINGNTFTKCTGKEGTLDGVTHDSSKTSENYIESQTFEDTSSTNSNANTETHEFDLIDGYRSDYSDDELDEEPIPFQPSPKEFIRLERERANLNEKLCQDFELLRLPTGIQDLIIGSLVSQNNLHPSNGKYGGYRNFIDVCRASRITQLPKGLNPPQPLDASRCAEQWNSVRISINELDSSSKENQKNVIYDKFRVLETFTLFYNYYYSSTPLEHDIAATLLAEREWMISKDGITWFLREGQPKFTNELCEVADFKVLKLDNWTAMNKLNFTLDHSILKEPNKSVNTKIPARMLEQGIAQYQMDKRYYNN